MPGPWPAWSGQGLRCGYFMKMLLSELAGRLGLVQQGPDLEIGGVNTLEKAGPDEISFLANVKYAPQLGRSGAGAVLLSEEFAGQVSSALISVNPYLDFVRVVSIFARPQGSQQGISPLAFVHETAMLEEDCAVYPFSFIGPEAVIGRGSKIFPHCYIGERCRIGQDCLIYPGVSIMADSLIGDRVILHPGVVIGSDGFGFALAGLSREKFPQIGRVVVEDDVEIGANTAIDRAALDETRVGAGSKLDNLVQVGHNVRLGKNNVIVAQVGISGSVTLGDNVVVAGQSGFAGHLQVGDNVVIGPKTGVGQDVPSGSQIAGVPAMDRGVYMRVLTLTPKLPEMYKRIQKLEKLLAKAGIRDA